MWQNLIVTIAVSAAALYVIWRLAPVSVRRWALNRLTASRWGRRFPSLARHGDQGGCTDCAARSDTRTSR